MTYDELKTKITEAIKPNGNQEITAQVLQDTLLNMVQSLGKSYAFGGVATPSTNPGTPDVNTFYLATEAGTYADMGGVVLAVDEVAIIAWDGASWQKIQLDVASKKALDNKVDKVVVGSASATFKSGFIAYNTGLEYSSSINSCTDYIDVDGATSIRLLINEVGSSSSVGLSFYADDYTYLSGVRAITGDSDKTVEQTVEVPIRAKYLRTTIYTAKVSEWYCFLTKDTKISRINIDYSKQFYVGAVNTNTFEVQSPTDGSITRLSKLFELGDASQVSITSEDVEIRSVFFYDSNLAPLSYATANANAYNLIIPTSAKYFRFGVRKNNFAGNVVKANVEIQAQYTNAQVRELPFDLPVEGSNYVLVNFSFNRPNADRELRYGFGVIYLPPNYNEKTAVPLVMYAPGSGFNDYSPSESNKPFVDYLNANGYAVAWLRTFWGYDNTFKKTTDDGGEFWGTPTNYAICQAFYRQLRFLFNITDVFIYAKSQGALQISSLPFVTDIPFRGGCVLSGLTSPISYLWGYHDSERIAVLKDFGCDGLDTDSEGNITGSANVMLFEQSGCPNYGNGYGLTEDRITYLLSQSDKFVGLIPAMAREITLSVRDYIEHYRGDWISRNPKILSPIPLLSFVAEDDVDIYKSTNTYHTAVSNANIYSRLRLMENGTSNPHNAATSLAPKVTVSTIYGGEMTVPMTAVEMLNFFKQL